MEGRYYIALLHEGSTVEESGIRPTHTNGMVGDTMVDLVRPPPPLKEELG